MTTIDDAIQLGVQPDIPGLRLRHVRLPEDFVGMARTNQATRDAAGMEEVVTAEAMERDYGHIQHWDAYDDTVIVELDGRIVAYGRVDWRDQVDGARAFMAILVVEPALAASGIPDALLGWAEARLVANARAIPPDERRPSTMRTFSFGAEAGLTDALVAHGWTKEGHGYEMVRPTLDDIPDVPMPAGLVVRPIGLDEASMRRVWEAGVEAFADERGEQEATEADWAGFRDDPDQDPALWVIAFDGDEIAGGVRGMIHPEENAHHGRERGLLDGVFTRRPWRRRGLARALMARSLARFRDHGMTSAYLGVDGLNPNQAMDLYTSLGFEAVSTTYDWAKALPADAGPLEDGA
jgi:mycothiol synthase